MPPPASEGYLRHERFLGSQYRRSCPNLQHPPFSGSHFLRRFKRPKADRSSQPFNAFLSGFSATVGQFVLTVSLRMQTNPENGAAFGKGMSQERAFADYVLGSLILHFFCVNFVN